MEWAEACVQDIALRHAERFDEIKQVISGGISGCVAKSAVAPLSRVTVLMQVQSMRPHKFRDGVHPNNMYLVASLQKIWKEEGMRGLWRGNWATCVHRFPYTSLSFYFNSKLRQYLARPERAPWAAAMPDQVRGLLAGGLSATVAVVPCYPLDVVKTRLMTQTKRIYYDGITDALGKILRDEGVGGLYRGLWMSICSIVPSLALNFMLYEEFTSLYGMTPTPPWLRALMAGGSSGALASTLLFPVDLLRRQMQMVGLGGRPSVYGSVFEAARHVHGIGVKEFSTVRFPATSRVAQVLAMREFFRGLAPELLKVVPNNAILFCLYNQLLKSRWPLERTPQERREQRR